SSQTSEEIINALAGRQSNYCLLPSGDRPTPLPRAALSRPHRHRIDVEHDHLEPFLHRLTNFDLVGAGSYPENVLGTRIKSTLAGGRRISHGRALLGDNRQLQYLGKFHQLNLPSRACKVAEVVSTQSAC